MLETDQERVRADDEIVNAADACDLERRVSELERAVAARTIEIEALREALALAQEKNAALQRFLWVGEKSSVVVVFGAA